MSRLERLRAPCQWGSRGRVALGVATAWPPVYFVVFIGFIVVWGIAYAIFARATAYPSSEH